MNSKNKFFVIIIIKYGMTDVGKVPDQNNYKSVAILIECDNQSSLGLACQRDVVNVGRRLVKSDPNWSIYILTNTPNYFSKFIAEVNSGSAVRVREIYSRQNRLTFEQIINKAKFDNNGVINQLYIHVTGHGYSSSDSSRNELDGRSEYVVTPTQTLSDITLYNILQKNLDKNTKIRISVDCCHSGTFSNLQYQYKNKSFVNAVKNPKPYFENAWSISSCLDSQSSMNDIGEYSGFGGSLTVQMLDNEKVFDNFMSDDKNMIISSLDKLAPILLKLKQVPMLLCDKIIG